MSTVGVAVLVAVLVLATSAGLYRRRRAGRMRRPSAGPALSPGDLGRPLGERATLVQFSSAFCRPCVATRHVLDAVAAAVPGLAHVELDAEANLDLVRRLGVASTPTTLLLDRHGFEHRRATGVPRRHELLTAIADAVDASNVVRP